MLVIVPLKIGDSEFAPSISRLRKLLYYFFKISQLLAMGPVLQNYGRPLTNAEARTSTVAHLEAQTFAPFARALFRLRPPTPIPGPRPVGRKIGERDGLCAGDDGVLLSVQTSWPATSS